MKLLMISTDRSILVPGSVVRERMREYGKLVEELHIIIFEQRKNFQFSISNDSISKNVFVYPTNSWRKWLYVFDAYHCAKRRLGNSRDQQWLITSQDPFETGVVGVLLKRRFGVPLQVQIHTDFLSPYFRRQSLVNRVRVFLARFTLPRADCIRVVSERVRQSLLKAKSYKLKAQITVLPIFVDAARFSARPDEIVVQAIRARYAQFDRLILMVGRLAPEKNIALAIEAMREVVKSHPRTGLVIVGDGPEKERLVLKAISYKLTTHVVFEFSAHDLAPYYHAADIFLHTSNYEGYGMVLVEAAAAGLPIVTTAVGIAGEVLCDGESALVCPVGDRACITEQLLRLLSDDALRARLGIAAQEAAGRHAINKEAYLERYRDAWDTCLHQRK